MKIPISRLQFVLDDVEAPEFGIFLVFPGARFLDDVAVIGLSLISSLLLGRQIELCYSLGYAAVATVVTCQNESSAALRCA